MENPLNNFLTEHAKRVAYYLRTTWPFDDRPFSHLDLEQNPAYLAAAIHKCGRIPDALWDGLAAKAEQIAAEGLPKAKEHEALAHALNRFLKDAAAHVGKYWAEDASGAVNSAPFPYIEQFYAYFAARPVPYDLEDLRQIVRDRRIPIKGSQWYGNFAHINNVNAAVAHVVDYLTYAKNQARFHMDNVMSDPDMFSEKELVALDMAAKLHDLGKLQAQERHAFTGAHFAFAAGLDTTYRFDNILKLFDHQWTERDERRHGLFLLNHERYGMTSNGECSYDALAQAVSELAALATYDPAVTLRYVYYLFIINISDIFVSVVGNKFELHEAAVRQPGDMRGKFDQLFNTPQGRDLIGDLELTVELAMDACMQKGKPDAPKNVEWRLKRLIRNSITSEKRKALAQAAGGGAAGAQDLAVMLDELMRMADDEGRLMAVLTQSVSDFGLQGMMEDFKRVAVMDYSLGFFCRFAAHMMTQTREYYEGKSGFKPAWVTDKNQNYDRAFALHQDARRFLSDYTALVLSLLSDIIQTLPNENAKDTDSWSVEFCAAKPMNDKINDLLYQNGISTAVHTRFAMIKNDIMFYKA